MSALGRFHCSPRKKAGTEITESSRLEFFEKNLANKLDAEDSISGPYSRFTFVESTTSNWPWVMWAQPLGTETQNILAASRTVLQWLLAWLNFTLDKEDLFCCYKWKCWKPRRWMWLAQAPEKHGDEWGLTIYLW